MTTILAAGDHFVLTSLLVDHVWQAAPEADVRELTLPGRLRRSATWPRSVRPPAPKSNSSRRSRESRSARPTWPADRLIVSFDTDTP